MAFTKGDTRAHLSISKLYLFSRSVIYIYSEYTYIYCTLRVHTLYVYSEDIFASDEITFVNDTLIGTDF